MKSSGYSRVSKDLIIKELEKELKSQPCFFIAEHGSISATSLDSLRSKLRTNKTRYFVTKVSLGRIALERASLKPVAEKLSGRSGFAFSSGDPALASKLLIDFSKENENFKIQAGYMNGQLMGADQIKVLASLPSREVLLGRVAGGMKAPITNFVGVLAGTLRKMVTVLDAIAKKKAGA